jgi:ketosteroid isomerase-like protein
MSNRNHDIEANKQIARDFMDTLSSGNPQRILSCYTDDATVSEMKEYFDTELARHVLLAAP